VRRLERGTTGVFQGPMDRRRSRAASTHGTSGVEVHGGMDRLSTWTRVGRLLLGLVALSALTGCSPKRMAANAVGRMLAEGTSSLGEDDDPAFLGDALPFALLMMEELAREAPENVALRAALASGFTQYAYGWADLEAQLVKFEDYDRYRSYRELARKRYLRARQWGMEGLALVQPGFETQLSEDPSAAVEGLTEDTLPLLYWTGTAWLGAISLSADRPDLIAELPQATALLERALALDPDYDDGGLQELFVALAMARGPGAGGGKEVALAHFERALALSGGQRASLFVTRATSVALKTGDRQGFVSWLEKALAVDPDAVPAYRVSNLLAQRKARYLLEHVDDLFD